MNISRNDQCPCGSGKKYKNCCLPRLIREEGIIPITTEIQEIFDEENERFKAIMGRDISGDDPIMPLSLTMSESEYKRLASEMLSDIGVNPRVIYAFNKLGFCIVEGEDMYSDEQRKQWDAAIKEYEDLELTGIDIKTEKINSTIEKIYIIFDKLQFLYALIIKKYSFRKNSIDLKEEPNLSDYVLFCLTRNLKSIKAIALLSIQDFPEDALNLSRTNLENYAEIVYSKYGADELIKKIKAENGIINGTHERKWKKIVNKANGDVTTLKSNQEKVKLNPKFQDIDSGIFSMIYSLLSSYTHPDISTAVKYIDLKYGFTALKENSNLDPMIIILIINFMIIHELQDLEFFETSKKDLIQLNKEIADVVKLIDKYIGKLDKDIRERVKLTLNAYD